MVGQRRAVGARAAESGPGQMPNVVGVLNALRQEGWELAAVSNTQSPLIYCMLLKRRASVNAE